MDVLFIIVGTVGLASTVAYMVIQHVSSSITKRDDTISDIE